MGSFHDAFARTHAAVARVHGQAATWTPSGGAPAAIILLPGTAAAVVEFDGLGNPLRTERPGWRIVAPHPVARGDTITLPSGHADAGDWIVSGDPVRGGPEDPARAFIHIELVRA